MIALTGYSGFVGTALCAHLNAEQLLMLGRQRPNHNDVFVPFILGEPSELCAALTGQQVLIHLAARVHIMNDSSSDPLAEFRAVNTGGTLNLARQAAEAGVKRFIFLSSIKVNGESTSGRQPFTAFDVRSPEDPYGQSKSEAETQLFALGQKTGMEIVIIRPPLVYGPGVKANFASLMNLVSKDFPLPFGCIKGNKRSLVSVKNLVDLIVTCIDHPKAANQVFLVSDDHDVSTATMVKHMSQALGKSSRLLPVPLWCYRLVGKLTGKTDTVDRLLGSLQVDISHTKDTLGWVPPQTLEQGFKETAEAFLLNKNK